MNHHNFEIRQMTLHEVDLAVERAASEGWNPGLHDAACFYETDSKGFLIGLVNGVPMAVVSAVNYDNNFCFLGFFMVDKKYRGQGYGMKIGARALDMYPDVTMGLDGVVEQQENYKKAGFVMAYNNYRFTFTVNHLLRPSKEQNSHVVNHTEVPFSDLLSYDALMFGCRREKFLRCWINQPDSYCYVWFEDGVIKGYGLIRKCISGYKIGPLFCDNKTIAETLIIKLIEELPEGEVVYLDIPEPNIKAMELVKQYNMTKVFETARMYRGTPPELPVDKIFGVTTFELG